MLFRSCCLTAHFQKASTSVGGGNKHVISRKGFRSPHINRFSEAQIPVNVQGRLTAASLATQAPGGKIVAARVIRLMPSACRVGAEPASLQAVPSARIPAGSPGQPSTPHRFSAGPGSSL